MLTKHRAYQAPGLPNTGKSAEYWRMLQAHQLGKSFGQTIAVKDVSFTVKRGEIVGFLGPNGAGKSTSIRMLAALLTPDHGFVEIDGIHVHDDLTRARHQLGYLPEGAPLYLELTPRQSLQFCLSFAGWTTHASTKRIEQVLEVLALGAHADQPVATLSKGFSRRTALALALATDANILLLDEPFDGFDPIQAKAGRALLQELSPDKAILICTHSLAEAEAVCDRILVLNQGQVVASGTVPELLAQTGTSQFEDAFCQLVAAK
ncbi:MAG: ABC transporter ATP-binding protein [Robiginitomaculum sp.]|nr:ABC transporter ATP-binding protein [Robiginitomaculum sp.]